MIKLTAESKCWQNHGQYIARIVGRHSKFTFAREFTGAKDGSVTTAYVDEPGLYEVVDLDKKGRKDITYYIVVPRPESCPVTETSNDPDFVRALSDAADASALARRLEAGEAIAEMIALRPSESEARPGTYTYDIRSKAEAKRASASASTDAAVAACWEVLQAFPPAQATKVLRALKERINPPKPKAQPEPAEPAPFNC